MSYEPTIWQNGDKITDTKLNKLENAVASIPGIMFVKAQLAEQEELEEELQDSGLRLASFDPWILDKTWKEISDAIEAGEIVIGIQHSGLLSVVRTYLFENEDPEAPSLYEVSLGDETYNADSEESYPFAFFPGSDDGQVDTQPIDVPGEAV
jgi:hypothetical protein